MEKKTFKQVCQCTNCGNEAEMMITCSLVPEEHETAKVEFKADKVDHEHQTKGHGVCSHCGNEADVWIDIEK